MRKRREKGKYQKQVGSENFSRKRRVHLYFSLFQLVLDLLGYYICWSYPWLFVTIFLVSFSDSTCLTLIN